MVKATSSGIAGFGVSNLNLGVTSSPVVVSTIAPFIPVPPISIPKISIKK